MLTSDHDLTDLLYAAGLAKSTYYYHRAKLTAPDHYGELKAQIQHLFAQHKQRFGYRRIHLVLRREGWAISKKLVWKLMHQLGLRSKVRRRRNYSSYRGTINHIADNLLAREFDTEMPNTKWVSDVTEFRVAGHKVYLSPIADLCDHSVLSYTTPNSTHDQIHRPQPARSNRNPHPCSWPIGPYRPGSALSAQLLENQVGGPSCRAIHVTQGQLLR